MARGMQLVGLALALAACSGNGNRQTNRGIGSGERADAALDTDEDTPDADSEPSEDAPDANDAAEPETTDAATADEDAAALDAATPADASAADATLDAGPADSGVIDAQSDASAPVDASSQPDGSADAGPDTSVPPPNPAFPFWIRVVIENPRGHTNPIQFALNGVGVTPDANGYLYAQSAPAELLLIMGSSDETQELPILGIEQGDQLHLLYRHFREPESVRSATFPAEAPAGTFDRRLETSAGGDFLFGAVGTGATRFHMVGSSAWVGSARAMGGAVLGFAVADDVAPPTTNTFSPVVLGPWRAPRTITLAASNASAQAGHMLFYHKGGDGFIAPGASANSYYVPPDFADFIEARLSEAVGETIGTRDYAVTRFVARCGPESDTVALDLGDALPVLVPSEAPEDGQTRWTFPSASADQRGDLLVFDGYVLPASQSSLRLPNRQGGSHTLVRVDLASAADYRALKRAKTIPLSFRLDSPWCQGNDYVRITQVEWQSDSPI